MSANDIVYKRQCKGRIHRDITKRVSFDERALQDEKIRELRVLRCSEELTVANFDLNGVFDPCLEAEKCDATKSTNNLLSALPFLERGTPEGQEDPQRYDSSIDLNDSVASGSRDTPKRIIASSSPQLNEPYKNQISKSTLLRRFLQHVHATEHSPKVRKVPKVSHRKPTSLYVKVKSFEQNQSDVLKSIEDEVVRNSVQQRRRNLNPNVLKLIGADDIYKVFELLNSDGTPLLAVITHDSVRFVSFDGTRYDAAASFTFDEMAGVVIGPFSQFVIVLQDAERLYLATTGASMGGAEQLVTHLEVAVRRWCGRHQRPLAFSVAKVEAQQRVGCLYEPLPAETFSEGDKIIAQYWVWLQENIVNMTNTPLGPQKCGDIMTKIGVSEFWSPAYICIKGGVLYIFEKNGEKIPRFAIPLKSTFYKGCRIHNTLERPHTFQILLEGNANFHFGASDEAEMMEWIRILYSSALKVTNYNFTDFDEPAIVGCFITLTTEQILLHQFPNKIISRAMLEDIVDFKRVNDSQNFYCLLEFNCREASEYGDDWILYFVSEACFNDFCTKFFEAAKKSFSDSTYDDDFACKGTQISSRIRSLWDPFYL